MRLNCYHCGKSVSTEVPSDTILRAIATCPECIENQSPANHDRERERRDRWCQFMAAAIRDCNVRIRWDDQGKEYVDLSFSERIADAAIAALEERFPPEEPE